MSPTQYVPVTSWQRFFLQEGLKGPLTKLLLGLVSPCIAMYRQPSKGIECDNVYECRRDKIYEYIYIYIYDHSIGWTNA